MFKLFILLSFIAYAYAGPAANCGSNSTDPCCNVNSYAGGFNGANWNFMQIAYVGCGLQKCVICGSANAQDTTTAGQMQSYIQFYHDQFTQHQCFEGMIADSPGFLVSYLDHKEYLCNAKNAACTINFYVDFDYQCNSPSTATHLSVPLLWSSIVSAVLLYIIIL